MNRYFIKCLMFTNNNNIKLKQEINGKIILYSHCIGCSFKKFTTINNEEIGVLLKNFGLNIKQCYLTA